MVVAELQQTIRRQQAVIEELRETVQQAEAAQAEAVRLVCEASEAELQKAFVAHDVVLSEREAELEEVLRRLEMTVDATSEMEASMYETAVQRAAAMATHSYTSRQQLPGSGGGGGGLRSLSVVRSAAVTAQTQLQTMRRRRREEEEAAAKTTVAQTEGTTEGTVRCRRGRGVRYYEHECPFTASSSSRGRRVQAPYWPPLAVALTGIETELDANDHREYTRFSFGLMLGNECLHTITGRYSQLRDRYAALPPLLTAPPCLAVFPPRHQHGHGHGHGHCDDDDDDGVQQRAEVSETPAPYS